MQSRDGLESASSASCVSHSGGESPAQVAGLAEHQAMSASEQRQGIALMFLGAEDFLCTLARFLPQ